jgi:ADP-heptose:LPS heptosyltransferase
MKKLLSPNIKKIAVFRALQLGDMLCIIPAIRALRNAYPDAEIALLGLPWAVGFVKRFPKYFNRFIHFPGYPGLPEQPFNDESLNEFLQRMQQEEFDLVLQMQGNGTIVNPLVFKFNAKYVAGFHNKESHVNSPLFIEYPNHGHEIKRHLKLMKHLGIPEMGTELEFPITEEDYHELDQLQLPLMFQQYVCVHPGSRGNNRQWPPEYFALLADYCADNGFTPVITGTEEERSITSEVRKYMRNQCIDLTGKTSIGAMAALLQDAAFLISNCTGVAHIAAALNIPGIIISMDGEPQRWGHAGHKVVDWTKNKHLDSILLDTAALVDSKKTKLRISQNQLPEAHS